MINYQKIM